MKTISVKSPDFLFVLNFLVPTELLKEIEQNIDNQRKITTLVERFTTHPQADLSVQDLFMCKFQNASKKRDAILACIFETCYEDVFEEKYKNFIEIFQKKSNLPKNISVILISNLEEYTSETSELPRIEELDGKSTAIFFITDEAPPVKTRFETKKSIVALHENQLHVPLGGSEKIVVDTYTIDSDLKWLNTDRRTMKSRKHLTPRLS